MHDKMKSNPGYINTDSLAMRIKLVSAGHNVFCAHLLTAESINLLKFNFVR